MKASTRKDALPSRYEGARSFGTAVYYLLTAETFSAIHRVITDEVWHFYCGDPVGILQLLPDGSGFLTTLGSDVEKGMQPQIVVPWGTWQGVRLVQGGKYALLGTQLLQDLSLQIFNWDAETNSCALMLHSKT